MSLLGRGWLIPVYFVAGARCSKVLKLSLVASLRGTGGGGLGNHSKVDSEQPMRCHEHDRTALRCT